MIKRDKILMVRWNADEYDFLCRKAELDKETCYKNGKKNLAGYIRKCALRETGYMDKANQLKELKNLSYQVRKIGVNINQATKKINSGYYNLDICMELQAGLDEINQKFTELLEQMREQNGDHEADEY